jgi:DNA-binding transcriptional ArsR family regulator
MKYISYENYFIYGDGMKKGLSETCYRFFSNLANPTRIAALEKLMEKPMKASELAYSLGQEQSMVSHNLRHLSQCNFVFVERQGKSRIYSANNETVDALFKVVENHAEKYCPSTGKCMRRDD